MSRQPGKKKLIKDISANTVQTLITQVFGILIFYITSKYLAKSDFGEFNWAMAVGSTIISISSLGLDLVFVKRVASGQNVLTTSGIHFFHTLVAGFVLCVLAFIVHAFVPSFTMTHPLFFFIFLNLAIANVANSFKLCMNGLEAYRSLAVLAVCSNVLKFLLIVYIYCTGQFTITNVIYCYLATSAADLILGYFLMTKRIAATVKPLLKVTDYKYFILESLPQLGVVLFDSALARIDWILLGILSTAAITAEYSFAYKMFELSKLPLLIIAPVMLTRFSRLFAEGNTPNEGHKKELAFFFRLELFIIMFIPLVLICTWTPLIDLVTNNKYGAVNQTTYWILAACIPFHAVINFLWTLGFVQGQLRTIMFITIAVSLINTLSNALLIPHYGGIGAAVAFLASTVIQMLLYLLFIKKDRFRINFKSWALAFANAAFAVLIGKFLSNNAIFATLITLMIFVALTFITGLLSIKQLKQMLIRSPENH